MARQHLLVDIKILLGANVFLKILSVATMLLLRLRQHPISSTQPKATAEQTMVKQRAVSELNFGVPNFLLD